MNLARREPRWAVFFTVLIALIVQVMPLPDWLSVVRPSFIGLVIIYWSIFAPHAGGIFAPWLAGLALDVFKGDVLGAERAGHGADRLHHHDPAPAAAQPDPGAAIAVRVRDAHAERSSWSGASKAGATTSVSSAWRWIQPMIGAMLWPFIAMLVGRTHSTQLSERRMGTVRIKDHWGEQRLFERRALAAAFIIAALTLVLIGRLVVLQVMRYDYYADLSQGNRVRVEPLPAQRGLILDRNLQVLAENRPSFQLELVRERVPDVDATLKRLIEIGVLDADELDDTRKLVRSRRSFESVPIRLRLTEEEIARFAVHRFEFPGVDIATRLARFYPHGEHAVHALGYVAAISEGDVKQLEKEQQLAQVRRHHADRQARPRSSPTKRNCTASTARARSW